MSLRSPIIPTTRAALLIAGAAPLALLIAALAPAAWVIAPLLGAALLVLVVVDGMRAGSAEDAGIDLPGEVEVGGSAALLAHARITGGAPQRVRLAVAADARLLAGGRGEIALDRAEDGDDDWTGTLALQPTRRGTALVDRLWLRWTGPLGLGARQVALPVGRSVAVWPNIAAVRSPALQTFLKDAQFGLIARRLRGEGTQFEALADYQPGMDRRRIDWKASARHARLYAKEYDTERNNQIVLAFDCGQAMCEPVAGMPRIDRAVSAGLATAYVALKGGDRVALYGFAARPVLFSPFVTEPRHFRRLQSAAAGLDYTAQEPNFTLALATLASRLQRRSLIVVFSDFTDPTSAELMIEGIGRLVARHLVLFVTLRDDELDELALAAPADAQALAMAVTADTLLRQRALVLSRLRALGVTVVEAAHDTIGPQLLDRYLQLKRSGAIG